MTPPLPKEELLARHVFRKYGVMNTIKLIETERTSFSPAVQRMANGSFEIRLPFFYSKLPRRIWLVLCAHGIGRTLGIEKGKIPKGYSKWFRTPTFRKLYKDMFDSRYKIKRDSRPIDLKDLLEINRIIHKKHPQLHSALLKKGLTLQLIDRGKDLSDAPLAIVDPVTPRIFLNSHIFELPIEIRIKVLPYIILHEMCIIHWWDLIGNNATGKYIEYFVSRSPEYQRARAYLNEKGYYFEYDV